LVAKLLAFVPNSGRAQLVAEALQVVGECANNSPLGSGDWQRDRRVFHAPPPTVFEVTSKSIFNQNIGSEMRSE
jgi:hypothetical protein